MKTVTCNLLRKNKKANNTKTVVLDVEGISQGQWSTFILELNLMKKAWKPYGVNVELKAHSIKKIIEKGTANADIIARNRRNSKKVSRNQRTIL